MSFVSEELAGNAAKAAIASLPSTTAWRFAVNEESPNSGKFIFYIFDQEDTFSIKGTAEGLLSNLNLPIYLMTYRDWQYYPSATVAAVKRLADIKREMALLNNFVEKVETLLEVKA